MKAQKRALIYVGWTVSSDGAAVEAAVRKAYELCAEEDWKFVRIRDEQVANEESPRPVLQQLIEETHADSFDVLLIATSAQEMMHHMVQVMKYAPLERKVAYFWVSELVVSSIGYVA